MDVCYRSPFLRTNYHLKSLDTFITLPNDELLEKKIRNEPQNSFRSE